MTPADQLLLFLLCVGERAIFGDGDVDGAGFLVFGHARQEVTGDVGEHGVGEDVVNVAGAGLNFGAALGDFGDYLGGVGQLDFVILADAALNLGELESDDGLHGFVAQREVWNGDEAAHESGLEDFVHLGLEGFGQAFGAGSGFGIGSKFHEQISASVGGENDDGVLEIDFAAFAVFHHALVEDLIEEFEDVGMSFLAFIEKNDGIGAAADGFGEDATFAVADVAWGRAFQAGDGVSFLVFGHVNGDEIALATVKKIRKSKCGFGFADSAGTDEHKDADGLNGVVHARAGSGDALGDGFERMVLADDTSGHEVL